METGTHAELVALGGTYANLVRIQVGIQNEQANSEASKGDVRIYYNGLNI